MSVDCPGAPPAGATGRLGGPADAPAPGPRAARVLLYVFSGTGNTAFAAEALAQAFRQRGAEVVIRPVRLPLPEPAPPGEWDLVGFGYPVHAFNTPRFFLRFVRTLPDAPGGRAFVFKTAGEPFHANSASSWPLVRLLRRKGYTVLQDRHLLMPYHILFRYPDGLARQMARHTRAMAAMMADQLLQGQAQRMRYLPWTAAVMLLFRLQWLGAWLNGPLIHVRRGRCSRCGRCVVRCPAQNISLRQGVPHFSHRCTMCMACATICPQDAVRPGFLTAWRVNGGYPYEALLHRPDPPEDYVSTARGYYALFRGYYRRTGEELARYGAKRSPADAGGQCQEREKP